MQVASAAYATNNRNDMKLETYFFKFLLPILFFVSAGDMLLCNVGWLVELNFQLRNIRLSDFFLCLYSDAMTNQLRILEILFD